MIAVAPAPDIRPNRRGGPAYRPGPPPVAFGLFLVLTGVLLVRPTEIVSALDGAPIFQTVILGCLAVTFRWVLAQLAPAALLRRPVTACVLGVAVAVPLSHLAQRDADRAVEVAAEFYKLVAYYLLLTAVVDTPERLGALLKCVWICVVAHVGLAVLNFHGWADIPAMQPHMDWGTDPETGAIIQFPRMCGVGLFGNPNDLSRMIAVGLALTAYMARELPRPFLVGLAGLAAMFVHALVLTDSRGGLIATGVTLLCWIHGQFGWRKSAVFGLAAISLAAQFGGGRQTDMDLEGGTGQQRIRLWLEGFDSLRNSPVFGIGAGRYPEITGGLGAHNAFVHSFVELGLVGGTCFLSAVALGLWQTYRLRPARAARMPKSLARAYPFVLAILAGYAAGLLSSSRTDVTPTYLLIGMTVAYQGLAGAAALGGARRLDGRLILQLVGLSAIVLVALYAFARLTVQWR